MVRAPKIVGSIWFNNSTAPVLDSYEKVLLVDFWTYTCVNCIRTLPYLKSWWQKYKNNRFMMVGVHTPEFEFEKDPDNVRMAIKKLGIEWPVVLDTDYLNWYNFANNYWPAKYLIDHTGNIVYEHFGEGAYEETELFIQKLLSNIDKNIVFPKVTIEPTGKVCYIPTPETYCGYLRGDISNPLGLVPDKVHHYSLLDDPVINSIALNGTFLSRPEYLETKDSNSELLLRFHAAEVNLVMVPVADNTVVEVQLNYRRLTKDALGVDLNKKGELELKRPGMYQLYKTASFNEGILSLHPKSGNFRAYAFTFSGCID
jgi:thiol-disulfide isomerase/thioredoxin